MYIFIGLIYWFIFNKSFMPELEIERVFEYFFFQLIIY